MLASLTNSAAELLDSIEAATKTIDALAGADHEEALRRLERSALALRERLAKQADSLRATLGDTLAAVESTVYKLKADLAAPVPQQTPAEAECPAAVEHPETVYAHFCDANRKEATSVEDDGNDVLRVGDLTPGERAVIDDANNDRVRALNAALAVEKEQEAATPAPATPEPSTNGRKGRRRSTS